jgi:hypothetical protein
MKRKLIGIVIGLLALLGVIGAGLAQAGNNTAKQTGQQVEKSETDENESSRSEDADEPGDVVAPGAADDD